MMTDAREQNALDVSYRPVQQVLAVPIPGASRDDALRLLVCGISSHLVMDDDYRSFLNLVATSIGGALVEAEAYEAERRRAEALAEIDRAKTTFLPTSVTSSGHRSP